MARGRPPTAQRRTSTTSKGSSASRWLFVLLLALVVAAWAAYRYIYPVVQRCPPPEDRFHEHCKEGRTHYVISIDWDCLGPTRAAGLAHGLGMPADEVVSSGVSGVPSWLSDENAAAVRGAPCIRGLSEDRGCWHCKPTPKPPLPAGLQDADAASSASAGSTASAAPAPDEL